jgi:hypothetical protein
VGESLRLCDLPQGGEHHPKTVQPRLQLCLHTHQEDRAAFVFDLMEPLRPIVDRKVIEFVLRTDFTIRGDGVCRLSPEMAAHIARIAIGLIEFAESAPFGIARLIR